MRIEYFHASRFGNGAMVASEFERLMSLCGSQVVIHHVRDVRPDELAWADLYVFSSPGRMGKPTRRMRRFLRRLDLAAGTRYAVFTTEMAPRPDKRTGQLPTPEQRARHQHVIPIMNEILQQRGLVKVADGSVYVTAMRGPLELGWRDKVQALVASINGNDTTGRSDPDLAAATDTTAVATQSEEPAESPVDWPRDDPEGPLLLQGYRGLADH